MKITPGGFFEFATLHRDRNMDSDLATPFGNIPYANAVTSHQDETRFTARRSRFILSTDADLDNVTHAKMYLATDFLSDAQTGTLTQSDSWNLRWRELYFKVDRSDIGAAFRRGSDVYLDKHELARNDAGHLYHPAGHRRSVHAWLYVVAPGWHSREQGPSL